MENMQHAAGGSAHGGRIDSQKAEIELMKRMLERSK